MTLELFRHEAQMYRRTSLVNVPSGTALADLRIPADRRGWVVVAHDASSDPASTIAELNCNGLATLCVRFGNAANARFLAETIAWLKRGVAEAQGLPVGLLGFGAAASAALEAAAALGTSLGALVTVNAAPDLAKTRLNGVHTFTLLIADEEHLGVNRRAAQRVRGVARLELAEGSLEDAARVYGAAWLCGHVGATGKAAPARGMLSRLVGSWRMPKLWLGTPSRAAAAFLLAAGAYFASAPSAHAAVASSVDVNGVLTVVGNGTDSFIDIQDSAGLVKVNGLDPDSGPFQAAQVTAIHINGGSANEFISVASMVAASFTNLDEIIIDGGAGNDTIIGHNQFSESLIGGTGGDSVVAQGGNDTLVGGSGELDTLSGGDGDDLVIIESGTEASPSADGGLNNDTLRLEGTAGDDSLTVVSVGANFERVEVDGGLGNDTLFGGALFLYPAQMVLDGNEGQDSIVGPNPQTVSIPAVTLLGSGGNDTLSAFPAAFNPAAVNLIGGLGDDSLVGGALNDLLQDGGPGSTTAFGGGGGGDSLTVNADSLGDLIVLDIQGLNFAAINGGFGNDIIELANIDVNAGLLQLQVNGGDGFDSLEVGNITGSSLAISLFGGNGNDTISGGALGDTIFGDAGDDSLLGNDGNDSIIGDDSLFGSVIVGNDTLSGGAGNDTLFGELSSLTGGDDLLFGDDGNDSLDGSRNNDTVFGGAGDDIFDDLDGGNDSLVGGTGNDQFFMKPGSEDTVADSGGLDTLSFAAATAAVRMDLSKQGVRQSIDTADNGLTLFGVFEGWTGSSFNDELFLTPIVSPRRVDGGPNDSVGAGDVLHYDPKGFGVTDDDTAGTLTPDSGGFGVVTYLNWESIDLTDSFDPGDIDGDSLPNGSDDDDDNDGIPDDKDPDRDGDGWDNDVEELFGTDPDDPTDFPDDSLVGGLTDSDGDGIPDEVESVTGNLDLGVSPGPLSVSKFKGKLKFPAGLLKDSLSFKARLAMPLGFTLDGAHIVVDIGGVIKQFDLDAKGRSSRLVKDDKAKMKLLPTKKQVQDGAVLADLTVTLKKQDFSPSLADEGLDDTASDTPTEEVVVLFVIVESSPFQAVKKVIYKNKTGFSGAFKNTKVVKPTP